MKVIELLKSLWLGLSLPLLCYCLGWLLDRSYRLMMVSLGRPRELRPLFPKERVMRILFGGSFCLVILLRSILGVFDLVFRPNVSLVLSRFSVIVVSLWIVLVFNRRITKSWSWPDFLAICGLILPVFLVAFLFAGLSDNNFEYDMITQNGKSYLHTSEQASAHEQFTHKYEIVNPVLMRKTAVDYDIHEVSEKLYGESYEVHFLQ